MRPAKFRRGTHTGVEVRLKRLGRRTGCGRLCKVCLILVYLNDDAILKAGILKLEKHSKGLL